MVALIYLELILVIFPLDLIKNEFFSKKVFYGSPLWPLEGTMIQSCVDWRKACLSPAKDQHGFRPRHSTTSAILQLLLSAPPLQRKMVEGSNNRFYTHRPMISPSNRNPGRLVDWWPPSIQPAGALPPRP